MYMEDVVEQKCEALCEALAQRVVERNFAGAHALLAPWLQEKMSPADIESMVDAAAAGSPPARAWVLDEGFLEVEDLGDDALGITGANYRGWLCIQFSESAKPRSTASFDLWLAAVEHDGAYRVGHLEPAGTD
jgi:hypothetical protein